MAETTLIAGETRCALCHGSEHSPDLIGEELNVPNGYGVWMWPCSSEWHTDWPAGDCRVYWGSHGCRLERAHDGSHECDCCECPNHERDHDAEGCVARAPFYGPETSFYGDDAPPNEGSGSA